jgi:ribonuclease HI
MIEIYTDGSCRNNGKGDLGAWGFLVVEEDGVKAVAKTEENTTNNRMELKAIIKALEYAMRRDIQITIRSDSMYCINCYKNWKNKWFDVPEIRSGAKNNDLWDELFEDVRLCKVAYGKNLISNIVFVKGHSDSKYNDIIDRVVRGLTK